MTMAARSATIRYASRSAVSGSSAYDLSRLGEHTREPVRRPDGEPDRRRETGKEPKPLSRPAAKTAARAQKSYGVSLFAVTGFIVVAVMMVFVLLAHVRYNEITSETIRLQARLDELTELERKLMIEYEKAFDIIDVEQYATNVLGMSKPDESQISVVKTTADDKAVVVSREKHETQRPESIVTFLASLVSYFK
jgi:cell division protein FtsL